MAAAMLARALLALIISGAVAAGGIELYPAALGVLVASKATESSAALWCPGCCRPVSPW